MPVGLLCTGWYRGIFKALFRTALPLLKRGFSIVKPHLKTAARNIASDVVTSALLRSYDDTNNNNGQNGNGLMVMSRGSFKPPGARIRRGSGRVKKAKRTSKRRTVAKRSHRSRTRCVKKRVKKILSVKRPLNFTSIPQYVGGVY